MRSASTRVEILDSITLTIDPSSKDLKVRNTCIMPWKRSKGCAVSWSRLHYQLSIQSLLLLKSKHVWTSQMTLLMDSSYIGSLSKRPTTTGKQRQYHLAAWRESRPLCSLATRLSSAAYATKSCRIRNSAVRQTAGWPFAQNVSLRLRRRDSRTARHAIDTTCRNQQAWERFSGKKSTSHNGNVMNSRTLSSSIKIEKSSGTNSRRMNVTLKNALRKAHMRIWQHWWNIGWKTVSWHHSNAWSVSRRYCEETC